MENITDVDLTTKNELAKALCKVQSQLGYALKDSVNPHFKSNYADLKSVWEACRKPLTENGFCVVQLPSAVGKLLSLKTILLHSSGESIDNTLSAECKSAAPMDIGSGISFLRRYALISIVGIAPTEDDGVAASLGKIFTGNEKELKRLFEILEEKKVLLEDYPTIISELMGKELSKIKDLTHKIIGDLNYVK